MPLSNKRLWVGTANFGCVYGLEEKALNSDDALHILSLAESEAWGGIDTASAYGHAENYVGDYFRRHKSSKLKLVTKMSPHSASIKEVESLIDTALKKLHRECIDYMLLHNAKTYFAQPEVFSDIMERFKQDGKIKGWGLSLYFPEELQTILEQPYPVSAIQIPASIFDRRFEHSNLLHKAREKDISIFFRSVFLKGLPFVSPTNLAAHFESALPAFASLQNLAASSQKPLAYYLLGYILNTFEDNIVLGCNNTSQLQEQGNILKVCLAEDFQDLQTLEIKQKEILIPSFWPKKNA